MTKDDYLHIFRTNQVATRRKPNQAATAPIVDNYTAARALGMRW